MLADLLREGTSIPGQNVFLGGKIVVGGVIFLLIGIVAGLMRWRDTQLVLYVLGLAFIVLGAIVYFGVFR